METSSIFRGNILLLAVSTPVQMKTDGSFDRRRGVDLFREIDDLVSMFSSIFIKN